jgi:hypothetical protein
MLATLLTIIVPGLGHLYYGYKKKAFIIIVLFLLGAFFLPLLIGIYIYALYDIWKILETKPKPVFSKSDAFIVVAIGLMVPVSIILLWVSILPPVTKYYRNEVSYPKLASEEGRRIRDALDKYYISHKAYPDKLELIVGGNPTRKRWLIDPWERPYEYITDESEKSYSLRSYGADGIRNTSDDIVLKAN